MLEPHLAWAGQTSATSQLAIVWVVQVVWSQLHAGSMKAALENMWATSCSCIPVILLVDTEILIACHFHGSWIIIIFYFCLNHLNI